MFHQNMTIKLWLAIWLTFIGLYFVLPQSELLEQENFVLPIMENPPEEEQSRQNYSGETQLRPGLNQSSQSVAPSIEPNNVESLASSGMNTSTGANNRVNGVDAEEGFPHDTTVSNDSYIANANLPYIPELEVGVTERAQVLNTLGQPARQLQHGKVLEYYFGQHSESLQVLTEEESNLLLQSEVDSHIPMYHLMIEFDTNNVIMAMNMQPLQQL
ncbi:hypothetical protein FE810_13680 [Thalassotalea litorea]|uniref:Uncharacterized protein n=1 Tax=Thalassotalea litorea TaxID=2020715 RepID=A0A5R9IER8_9GAMM|nr:hypothetical protein [Thalassotalea litorea]TLU61863.1 hypothetical protein FE810_13680 [Thalassotalea litorea]